MDGDTLASLFYLGLLITVIGGGFFMSHRQPWLKSVHQLASWVLIFLCAIAAYGIWGDVQRQFVPQDQATVLQSGAVEVARNSDGHFYLTLQINEVPVEFMLDTGATDMVLTKQAAANVGIDPMTLNYIGRARTANGIVGIARTDLREVAFGGFTDRNVRASVNSGDLDISLLGMRYLDRFSSVNIAGNTLTLER